MFPVEPALRHTFRAQVIYFACTRSHIYILRALQVTYIFCMHYKSYFACTSSYIYFACTSSHIYILRALQVIYIFFVHYKSYFACTTVIFCVHYNSYIHFACTTSHIHILRAQVIYLRALQVHFNGIQSKERSLLRIWLPPRLIFPGLVYGRIFTVQTFHTAFSVPLMKLYT